MKGPDFKDYLGDGLYVSFDGYQIVLSVNEPGNKVAFLEPEVFARLIDYRERLGRELDLAVKDAERKEF